MIKQAKGSWVVITFFLWCSIATAEPLPPVASEQEFLEFLGGWELEDGTWVNPLELLESDIDINNKPLKKSLSNPQSYEHDQTIQTDATKTTTPP